MPRTAAADAERRDGGSYSRPYRETWPVRETVAYRIVQRLADRWPRVTKTLARAVAEVARRTDLTTVATHFAINRRTVAGVLHRVVQWGLVRRRRKPLGIIGPDEVSRTRGQRYLTLVHDLGRGQLGSVEGCPDPLL